MIKIQNLFSSTRQVNKSGFLLVNSFSTEVDDTGGVGTGEVMAGGKCSFPFNVFPLVFRMVTE